MAAADKSPLASVIGPDGRCIGFVFRGRQGEVKAYDADEDPIGIYTDEAAAVAAVLNHKRGGDR
jgi:hypothetical protein